MAKLNKDKLLYMVLTYIYSKNSYIKFKISIFFNSNNHVTPLAPNSKTIEKVLTSNNCSIIGKLEPVDWVKELERETKLAVLFSFNMLYISIETHNPRANGAKRRSGRKPGRGLPIPHGYLHPGKSEHSEV